ncbi:MAG: hypothetical protein IPM39_16015 [Chloroflexi bacterium]|nr:hypothetical protein [Chloroflexota bacterium]
MTRLIFSGAAGLHIPSPHVLRFLDRQVDFVAYEVAGFGPDVLLLDYRESQQAARGRPGAILPLLAAGFERPSHLEIWEFGPQHTQIELHDTIQTKAPWRLSLTDAQGRTRPDHRAFYQRLPASPAETGGTLITLARQQREPATPRNRVQYSVTSFQ